MSDEMTILASDLDYKSEVYHKLCQHLALLATRMLRDKVVGKGIAWTGEKEVYFNSHLPSTDFNTEEPRNRLMLFEKATDVAARELAARGVLPNGDISVEIFYHPTSGSWCIQVVVSPATK